MGVLFFPCFRFIVEDVDVSVANLEKIEMAGDDVAFEVEIESVLAVVFDVLIGEEYGYFHRNGNRVIDQHEALQGFMPLPVVWRCGQSESRESSRVVLFPLDRGMKTGGKSGCVVLGFLEEVVRVMLFDACDVAIESRAVKG